jgi:hypothetical protein
VLLSILHHLVQEGKGPELHLQEVQGRFRAVEQNSTCTRKECSMSTLLSKQFFYYLLDDTDLHDTTCCCNPPQPLPHRATVARLYKLDVPGLQALNDDLHLVDEESFGEWLQEQKPQTSSGSDKQTARDSALQQAREDGKLVINYPEAFPWILPVASLLRGVVGYSSCSGLANDGCLPNDVCECNSMHTREQTVCRACYARLVCNILYRFVYAHRSRRQREGVSQ